MEYKKLFFTDKDIAEMDRLIEKLKDIEVSRTELADTYAGACGAQCMETCAHYCQFYCEKTCSDSCSTTCKDECKGSCSAWLAEFCILADFVFVY
jgi:hypothetical protein